MTLIEKIRDLVANGQTEKSIEELLSYVKENNNEVMDQLVLLKGRMKTLNNAIIEGTIENDVASIERAKINESILKILNDITPSYLGLERPASKIVSSIKPMKKSYTWLIIVGIITLAVGIVVVYFSEETVQNQEIQIQIPLFEHNLVMNNAYWMKIWLPGRIIGAKGKKGQLVTHFSYNGQLLLANPKEVAYRDTYGYVAVGTQPFDITTNNYYINDQIMYIPYSSLNLNYTGGQATYNLAFFVEVYVNGVSSRVTAYQPFVVKW